MNMLVKKVVVLTATLMIGTSCFAMLPEDLATDRKRKGHRCTHNNYNDNFSRSIRSERN